MNLPGILGYEKDPKEDYYAVLGCDRSSNKEQILTEYKLRAKECHPDKHNTKESLEKFQLLQQVCSTYDTYVHVRNMHIKTSIKLALISFSGQKHFNRSEPACPL